MGLFDWTKKKATDTVETGKKFVGTEEIKNNAVFIKDMATKLLNPKESLKGAKKETFIDAKNRLHINELDIIRVYKNNAYSFYISLIFAFVCIYVIAHNSFISFSFMGMLSGFSILLVCLAQCFRFSFRAFQIRHQKLCSPSDWLKRPSEWLPTF